MYRQATQKLRGVDPCLARHIVFDALVIVVSASGQDDPVDHRGEDVSAVESN